MRLASLCIDVCEDWIINLSTSSNINILAICKKSTLSVINANTLSPVSLKKKMHQNGISGSAISFSGTNIVTIARAPAKKQAIKLWDASTPNKITELHKLKAPHDNLINGAIFNPKNNVSERSE